MPHLQESDPEEGQFDDAPEEATNTTPLNPRDGHNFIDEDNLLEWSSEEEEEDEFELEENAMEAEAFETLRAEDEDWEIAERDFTKQYNRLKQHVAVRTGTAQGVLSSVGSQASVAALPAVNRPRPVKQAAAATNENKNHSKDKTENQLQALAKYSSRLKNLDIPYDLGVGVNRKGPSATANMKDKSDRATTEQVLDPRTRIILFKMIGRGLLHEVNGCVSTGKEANVYHAVTPEHKHLAIKIYKTSILVFKDRDRYVSGEYRFRRGYSRHNPRKMVRLWAEKEMRNLKRLRIAGIRCPEPVEVRENVLVMSFIGDKDGWASPRLKDANIPESEYPRLYSELLLMVRKMYHECKLVHADLSEYNILHHIEEDDVPVEGQTVDEEGVVPSTVSDSTTTSQKQGHLYIIDVSQSVEHDHPHAFDFLRSDLHNIEDFFSKRGVSCLGLRRSFEFITSQTLEGNEGDDDEAKLRKRLEEAETGPEGDSNDVDVNEDVSNSKSKNEHEDEIFMKSYIPRTLNEVYDPERDVGALTRGEGEKLIYKDTIGLVQPIEKMNNLVERVKGVHFGDEHDDAVEADEDGSEDSDLEESEGEGEFKERKPRGHRNEDKEAKKERKKATKEEAREKRKHKIPKAEKKRKIKVSARGK
ncbi:RIO1 family-domain-containing protein [Abortiporus biennis]|nr:RIO1 family-domain-containing protein [Abortiporus biennis]